MKHKVGIINVVNDSGDNKYKDAVVLPVYYSATEEENEVVENIPEQVNKKDKKKDKKKNR